MAYNNFVPLLKKFTAIVLKCKARLKTNFKCAYVTMCFSMMSLFSRDNIKVEIDYVIKASAMFKLAYKSTVFAWFLDVRTSILAYVYLCYGWSFS